MVDERAGGKFISTAFLAKINLLGRLYPGFFTTGHVFDLQNSGSDSRSLQKVHLIFNNLKGKDEVHCRKSLGKDPVRFKLYQDFIKRENAVTVVCHMGKMYTKRQREWRVTECAEDLDFAAVIFEDSVERFQKRILRKYHFNPYLFNVTKTFNEEPGRPVTMFGYPAVRKEMTFLFGSEKSQDDCSFRTSLRNEISLAKERREREDLIQFERGLRHVFLYDIETHAGSSGTPVLNYKYEAKAIHVRSSPRPFNILNQGTSFAVIADILESVL